jgi:hypothetical protein
MLLSIISIATGWQVVAADMGSCRLMSLASSARTSSSVFYRKSLWRIGTRNTGTPADVMTGRPDAPVL